MPRVARCHAAESQVPHHVPQLRKHLLGAGAVALAHHIARPLNHVGERFLVHYPLKLTRRPAEFLDLAGRLGLARQEIQQARHLAAQLVHQAIDLFGLGAVIAEHFLELALQRLETRFNPCQGAVFDSQRGFP